MKIDLFCRVVDNFGDIGVCWRLARQLADEQDCYVCLIVDDFAVFKKIEPGLDENAAQQILYGIEILRWQEETLSLHYHECGDAVIEAFACDLPDRVITLMQAAKQSPAWIDLEYLSAEKWVEKCHAIPSQHPVANMQKTLFFPGFTEKTGGLFRERNLLKKRSIFCADVNAQNSWRKDYGIPARQAGIRDIFLFCYASAPVEELCLDLSPQDRIFTTIGTSAAKSAHPQVHEIPFLPQTEFDHLLWTCDLNFVRGEDSWLRAIWAGKPFIWQAYPQSGDASQVKLTAFLKLFQEGLVDSDAELLADFHALWNLGGREGKAGSRSWQDLLFRLPVLAAHTQEWAARQAGQEDCATRLVRFIRAQQN